MKKEVIYYSLLAGLLPFSGYLLLKMHSIGWFSYFNTPRDLMDLNTTHYYSNLLIVLAGSYIVITCFFLFGYVAIGNTLGFKRKEKTSPPSRRVLLISLFVFRYLCAYTFTFYLYYQFVDQEFALVFYGFIAATLFTTMFLVEKKSLLLLGIYLRYSPEKKWFKTFINCNPVIHINTYLIWLITAGFTMYSFGRTLASQKTTFYSYDNGVSLIVSMNKDRILTIHNYSTDSIKVEAPSVIEDKFLKLVKSNR